MKKIFKRIKLDKFINGRQQRIFKTTTDLLETQNISGNISTQIKKGNSKNIYYGNYSINSISKANKTYENNLIDFHQINYDYINNRPDKLQLKNVYSDLHNPIFTISANIIKEYTTEQDNQRISFFPEYIYTPIDISKYNNSYFMLLPINTNRFINIAHPDSILKEIDKLDEKPLGEYLYKDKTFKDIPFKQNYTKMLSSFYEHIGYTSQDNNIPIYDFNLTNIQTIKFPSSQQAFKWIIKWNFQDIIYQKGEETISLLEEILYNSQDNIIYKDDDKLQNLDNYDSICVFPLIGYLCSKTYLYNHDTIIAILSDLLSNLDQKSLIRYVNPIGKINKLNNNLINSFILSGTVNRQDLNKQNIFNIKDLITRKQESTFSPQILPQNTLLIGNTTYPLAFNTKLDQKEYFPSCYINFLHLKNARDPEYQIKCNIINIYENTNSYKDYVITNEGIVSSIVSSIYDNTELYDNDGRFSMEYNDKENQKFYLSSTLIKTNTKDILKYSISVDNEFAKTIQNYSTLYPMRMVLKQSDYLNQYNNLHICHNKLYDIGTLDGIRNYLKTGVSFNDNTWLSYKYTNINLDLDPYTNYNSYDLPFDSYSLNRNNHWVKDLYGNNRKTVTMKYYQRECPYTSNCQAFMGCKLPLETQCKGFCAFPCKGKIKTLTNSNIGLNWNSNEFIKYHNYSNYDKTLLNNNLILENTQFFIIPSSQIDLELFAQTDLQVNDDLQIFFVSGLNDNNDFRNIINNISYEQELSAIFNGFGRDSLSTQIKYQEILYRNNNNSEYTIADNTPFNGPHIISKNTKLVGLNLNTKQITTTLSAGQFALIRIKSWWSDTIRGSGTIKCKPVTQNINLQNNIMNSINNYQFIESIQGFYKFKQKGLHKSNIYSINMNNTGLNPDYDKKLKYYTKQELIDYFENKYFVKYYEQNDSFLNTNRQNTFIYTKFHSYFNDNGFCKSPYFKNLYQKYKSNNLNGLSGFILYLKYIPFEQYVNMEGLLTILKNNETLYYFPQELEQMKRYNDIRNDIRELLQKAIRTSITKYMPADTNLWKIEYSGF